MSKFEQDIEALNKMPRMPVKKHVPPSLKPTKKVKVVDTNEAIAILSERVEKLETEVRRLHLIIRISDKKFKHLTDRVNDGSQSQSIRVS